MAKKLVIVESPAKAKTIGGILGGDYEVQASIGHIRDLPPNAKGLAPELRKKWWADYAVDVEAGFEPIYEVPDEKKAQVAKLRQAMKGKDTLVLATDEDREGESISWHLLQVLKPPKSVKVQRIAFHEITREAIQRALKEPRAVDMQLVEAQEARRILDRLYGYTLSPVLWSRVTKNLSAGRVQSPAVKLIVEREELRRHFHQAGYWGLKADIEKDGIRFPAELRTIDSKRVATGADFDDSTGQLREGREALLLDQARAESLAAVALQSDPWKVIDVSTKEANERPAPPFMTTSLQQEGNRKFGWSADRTMRIAQTLYEGVSLGGESVGLITYMRTDSLALSAEAVDAIRSHIRREHPDCLPDKAERYASKVRNAQEAHEAIRPTDVERKPATVQRYLNDDQNKLYDLIWKRTVACQMKPARVLKTEAEIQVVAMNETLGFEATGKQILFDGFRRIYLEGIDDPDAEREAMERKLPKLAKGDVVQRNGVEAQSHQTKPPPRYTDATLIRKLEEQGIGRPSTYAQIIATIFDRGYIRKSGKQLIPTWRAYLTMEVLQKNFAEFMDLQFTAKMDEALDEIAEGKAQSKAYLHDFFLGTSGVPGLKSAVDERRKEIPYPAFHLGDHPETGEPIVVRNGPRGNAFLQLGPKESKRFGDVPEDLAPADLTIERAIELLEHREAGPDSAGTDPRTGRRLLVRNRGGYYLEVERTPEELEAKVKPTWVSVPPGVDPKDLSQEELNFLCSLPRLLGEVEGQAVSFKIGKFGAYVEQGLERRTVEDWRAGATMTIDEALALLAQPRFAAAKSAKPAALREFGVLDGSSGAVKLMSGRYGPYVTDGETNATLPKGTDPQSLSPDQAAALLQAKREAGPSKRPFKGRKFAKKRPTASSRGK